MGIIDRILNNFGYELYVKSVEEILDSEGRQEFYNYPWIYRAHIRKKASSMQHYENQVCDIPVAHGAEVKEDGIPVAHTLKRLRKLKKLLHNSERGIITGKKEAKPMQEYAINVLRIPEEKLYIEDKSGTALMSMHNVKKMVEGWAKRDEIAPNPTIHYITQYWAEKRTKLIADCVLEGYPHIVYGELDGRRKHIVSEDAAQEDKKLEIDTTACKIYKYIHRPFISQVIATVIKDFWNLPNYVKGRI